MLLSVVTNNMTSVVVASVLSSIFTNIEPKARKMSTTLDASFYHDDVTKIVDKIYSS